jgi:hypothetical protein
MLDNIALRIGKLLSKTVEYFLQTISFHLSWAGLQSLHDHLKRGALFLLIKESIPNPPLLFL